MHFDDNFSGNGRFAICVSTHFEQLGTMEVLRCRAIGLVCALSIFGGSALGQGASPQSSNAAAPSPAPIVSLITNMPRKMPANYTVVLDNQHRIRAGDKLSFRVAEDNEEAKSLMVMDSGEIELPAPFGRYFAAGKTCQALAQEIRTALEKDYYKRATVHLGLDSRNNLRGKALVHGQVAKPGPVDIPVDAPLKLSHAILLAGPPTQWAKLQEVRVTRVRNGETKTMTIDVRAILQEGRLDHDIVLEPDDRVFIPERGVLIR
jgi:protein involved in polysaccharide export with SLBB domain